MQAAGEAISLLQQAAGDSSHPKVGEALSSYEQSRQRLTEAASLLAAARGATDDYAGAL